MPIKLPFIEKVKKNQDAFANKVIDIANKLGTKPEYLMIVMNNESGLDSTAKNPTSSASGLIQFMEATAKELGTTTKALREMSNIDQLDYVYKYLNVYKNKLNSAGEVYLSVFYPLALFKDDKYLFPNWVVKANKIFDTNKDGILTKGEFKDYVNKKYAKYLTNENTTSNTTKTIISGGTILTILSIFFIYRYFK
ncbi:MAG: transglycosylase SLT domain-containing protein [Bacteroidota bacterium]